MLTALNQKLSDDPKQLLSTIRSAVDDFVGSAEQFDDLTMLCLYYAGPSAAVQLSLIHI